MSMNEKHEHKLKEILSVSELPDVVVKFYARVKKLADRKDILITDQVLLLIASTAEELPEAETEVNADGTVFYEKVEDAIEELDQPKTPEPGIPCEVSIDGEVEQAVYLEDQDGVDTGRVRIRLIGATEPTTVSEHNVKLKE